MVIGFNHKADSIRGPLLQNNNRNPSTLAPTMYPGDKKRHEITVDAKTSADIDAYLSEGEGINTLEIIIYQIMEKTTI
jgi:hypothetical protein